LICSAVIC